MKTIEMNKVAVKPNESILMKSFIKVAKLFIEPHYCQICGINDTIVPISANGYCKHCQSYAFYDTWR